MEFGIAAGMFKTVNETRNAWQGKTIKNLEPALLIGNDPCLTQNREVTGNGGPTQPARLDQIVNALLLRAAQFLDNSNPSRVRQGAKYLMNRSSAFYFHSKTICCIYEIVKKKYFDRLYSRAIGWKFVTCVGGKGALKVLDGRLMMKLE
jgi:hypothetical protein